MLFEKFKETSKEFWNEYFIYVSKAQEKGFIQSNGGTIFYPNMILCTDCNGYYISELIGASKKYNGLTLKTHKEKSINQYLSQFEDDGIPAEALFHLNASQNTFSAMCLTNSKIEKDVVERFPFLSTYQTFINREDGRGSLLTFGNEFKSCALLDSAIINKRDVVTRVKFILGLYIFSNKISRTDLIKELSTYVNQPELHGVHAYMGEEEQRKMIASQLQNTFLLHGIQETTIGEFIKLHPDIIKKAFDTDHFLYEPLLNWIEHDGTCEDSSINPDLLVRRKDGTYDIYDLKTALLNKARLTTPERRRRQFIHTIRDGIAQLGNYQEYFQYPKNAQHALEKYGIVVKNPNLVLIVGNMENFDAAEVSQAGRLLPNIQIIDYDTLCHLFMGPTVAHNTETEVPIPISE